MISRIMPRIIPTNHTLVLKPCFQASGESYPYFKKQPSPDKGIFLKIVYTIQIGSASPCSEASRLIPNEILKDEELNAAIAASLPRSHDFEVGPVGGGFWWDVFFLNQGYGTSS